MPEGKVVKVYCDGSIARTAMDDALRAHSSDFVGRIAVMAPALDYGLVEKFYDSLALPNGHENSLQAEINAIRKADAVMKLKKDDAREFVIYRTMRRQSRLLNCPI